MSKKIYKAKEPIKLRFQDLKDGNKSIYLDCYAEGKRRREFLKLYIIPEHSAADKAKNAETLRLATAIKGKRIAELQDGAFGFRPTERGKMLLSKFLELEKWRYQERGSKAYSSTIHNTIKQIEAYGDRPLNKIDKKYMLGFSEFLKSSKNKYGKPFSINTQSTYYSIIVIALNRAVGEDIIPFNPSRKISANDKPQPQPSRRVYLTIDELNTLKHTTERSMGFDSAKYENVRRAFFFSCYTGLRYSDIKTLRWSDIKQLPGGGHQIYKRMQKTQTDNNVPLSPDAKKYLPKKPKCLDRDGLIFSIPEASCTWDILQDWCKHAGLKKHISFHVSRHTFATLELWNGAPLEVVQKLLGHKKIETTQIYAKVVDEMKIKAVELIPSID